jgi:hypothetical protein
MKLSAPKMVTFIVAVVLALIAVIFAYVPALGAEKYAFLVAVVSIIVFILGNLVKGL